jgi:hypoxanthine phosphoribosyltransferase
MGRPPNKINVTWTQYLALVQNICTQIQRFQRKHKISAVIGIPRGGTIPAIMISHALGIKYLERWEPILYKTVLLVDDVTDHGTTLENYKKSLEQQFYLKSGSGKILTAVLYKHKKCPLTPDFYVAEKEKWVVFPYEKRK